jgi:hypothetical protein
MQKTILFLILCMSGISSYCQVVAIQLDKENVAYIGMPNPITVAAENWKSSAISISTNNGTIEGEKGHYVFSPVHVGTADIMVKRKTAHGLKVIGGTLVRVKTLTISTFLVDIKKALYRKKLFARYMLRTRYLMKQNVQITA